MRNEIKRIWIWVWAAVLAAMALPVSAADYYAVGDKGGDVLLLQQQLIKRGYDVEADGVFSKDMAKAVSKFQKDQKIQVSGKVGGWTYYLLTGKRTLMPKNSGSKAVQKSAKSKQKPAKKTKAKKADKTSKLKYTKLKSLKGSDHIGHQLVDSAYQYIGVPYVFGGNTPKGFDCSGFTKYVFSHNGIELPRMADEQYRMGFRVRKNELIPGDLVFFTTYEPGVSHTGLYVGDGNFISATSSGGIRIDSLKSGYWSERYIGAKRVR